MAWISKIVGHGKEDPEQLLANPANFRTHTLFQRRVLEGAIDEIGFIRSVIVNVTTGHVIDGHERIRLAMERNEPFIDVEYVELTPEEELKALTTLDPIAALAGTDRPKLAETMAFANIKNDALTKLCGILAAQNGLDKTLPTPPAPAVPSGPPPSPVRQVQLFFDQETYTEFIQLVVAVAKHYQLTNQTDTVMETLRYAHRQFNL